jgi:tetratricopeptide (TPR) repeat protein
MKRQEACILLLMFSFLLLTTVMPAQTQDQPYPAIQAGSAEDKALQLIDQEPQTEKRIAMLEQFLKDFPAMAKSPDVNFLFVFNYRQMRNGAKLIEYAEKVLAVKPDDLSVLPLMIDALLEQQNQYSRAYEYAKHYEALVQNFDSLPGGGLIQETDRVRIWGEAKSMVTTARQQKEYADIQAAYQETDNDKKIRTLEGFAKEFPDSTQICAAYSMLALSYLQKQNAAQSAASAEKCLKIDPNNLDMLVLLADLQVEDKAKTKQTAELVAKAVELSDALESTPVPAGQAEADWTKRKTYYRGMAHGLRGYLDMKAGLYAKAIPDLEMAQKLMGDDSAALYRLGFALAKLKRNREAATYLTRAAKIPGPFQEAARKALSELNR